MHESDFELVLQAACRFDIPEYRLFTLAYQGWFGTLDHAAVDRAFTLYMCNRVVPAWVRHFARSALIQGKLPAAAGNGLAKTKPAWRLGIVAVMLTLGAVVLVLGLAAGSQPPAGCFFPPCY